ncbi:hypothetical protein HZA85_03965 [Candidatus Uhrbacteria bacterium]|nr:hypothetical protein [Candidatus Uhrbacteria bacterium]
MLRNVQFSRVMAALLIGLIFVPSAHVFAAHMSMPMDCERGTPCPLVAPTGCIDLCVRTYEAQKEVALGKTLPSGMFGQTTPVSRVFPIEPTLPIFYQRLFFPQGTDLSLLRQRRN